MVSDIPRPMLPAVSFRGVGKSFAGVSSLVDVGFDVPRGALYGLVGVNGAGKTTLIKCLLDATRAQTGEIRVFGDSSTRTEARRHLAFLPERFNAPYYATGRDFLQLMARLYGHAYDEPAAILTLGRLDLDTAALGKAVRTYSKGMTQKLGLAACLMSGRPLLLLDEPTSGLDPKARALLKAALKARNAEGTTVLFTSHALADVEELCDRMAVLHAGRLLYAGTPAALRAAVPGGSLEAAFLHCIGGAVPA